MLLTLLKRCAAMGLYLFRQPKMLWITSRLNDGKFGTRCSATGRYRKLLLQLEETEAVKLQEKLMLTESETAEVIRAGRGEGLLCAGRNRIAVEIRSSGTEFDLITTDRESLAKRVKTE